jgi:hypothetical protein
MTTTAPLKAGDEERLQSIVMMISQARLTLACAALATLL